MNIANKIHEDEKMLRQECENFINTVMNSSDLKVPEAISYVMIVRFFKRIIGHLGNITTSVSMPVHKLDYFDENYLQEADSTDKKES